MIAVPLIFGRLTAADYEDTVARDPRIDALRARVTCVEEPRFTADYHGLHSLDRVGEDNICFETDYPHTDTTWPNSKEYAEKMLADFDEKVAYKVLRGNAIKMLELDRT